jgi:hypothetical protein
MLQEGVAAGEFPGVLDVETTARALTALLDGVVLECISSGVPPTRADVQRRALLLVGPAVQGPADASTRAALRLPRQASKV